MARVWGVQDADDKLSGWVSEDEAELAPTGETAVLESVIRVADPPGANGRIQSGGHWDGTTYTPPVGNEYFIPYDPTTDAGMVKDAAHDMMDVFDDALTYIADNRLTWAADVVEKAIEGIHWQAINSARVALNATRTHARRQKFCEESASWPNGVNGNVREYVDAFGGNSPPSLPTKDWCWVNPEVDPFVRHTVTVGSNTGFGSATNVEDAPSSVKLIGRAWIDDIP